MPYQRTQIYLDPEEHRRLLNEAAERGLSLAEYLRRIIGSRAGEPKPAYAERSFDGIFNLFASDLPLDTVETMDEEVAIAFEEEHVRSLNRERSDRKRGRGPRRK